VIDAAGYGAAASGAGALAALLMRPEQAEPGIEGRPDPDAPPTQERDQAVIDGALAGLAGGALGAGAASLWMNRKAGSPEVVARVQSTRGGGGQPPAAAPPPAPKGPPGGGGEIEIDLDGSARMALKAVNDQVIRAVPTLSKALGIPVEEMAEIVAGEAADFMAKADPALYGEMIQMARKYDFDKAENLDNFGAEARRRLGWTMREAADNAAAEIRKSEDSLSGAVQNAYKEMYDVHPLNKALYLLMHGVGSDPDKESRAARMAAAAMIDASMAKTPYGGVFGHGIRAPIMNAENTLDMADQLIAETGSGPYHLLRELAHGVGDNSLDDWELPEHLRPGAPVSPHENWWYATPENRWLNRHDPQQPMRHPAWQPRPRRT